MTILAEPEVITALIAAGGAALAAGVGGGLSLARSLGQSRLSEAGRFRRDLLERVTNLERRLDETEQSEQRCQAELTRVREQLAEAQRVNREQQGRVGHLERKVSRLESRLEGGP